MSDDASIADTPSDGQGERSTCRPATAEVSWGGRRIVVDLRDDSPTVLSVKEQLVQTTGIPPHRMKLIRAGKVLSEESVVGRDWRLRMIGSSDELKGRMDSLVKDDLSQSTSIRRKYAVNASKLNELHGQKLPQSRYGFQAVETLPGLPDESTARRILTELARDPGIRSAMEKFQWTVGTLCEMYPEGYVGVSDVCVMGLNENRGQRIRLRIRTDDLLGFRKPLSIRKVLYHELAHNRVDEHNDDFYRLAREIEQVAERNDWRNSRAHFSAASEYSQIRLQQDAMSSHSSTEHLGNALHRSDTLAVCNDQEPKLKHGLLKSSSESQCTSPSNEGTGIPDQNEENLKVTTSNMRSMAVEAADDVDSKRLTDAIEDLFAKYGSVDSGLNLRLQQLRDALLELSQRTSQTLFFEILVNIYDISANFKGSYDDIRRYASSCVADSHT